MRWLAGPLVAFLVVAGTVSVACRGTGGQSQVSTSADERTTLDAYFHAVADVGKAHQAARLKTTDPLDPYSPEIPPLIAQAAKALAEINAPTTVASLHNRYAASVKTFAEIAAAVSLHHDEIVGIIDNATPTSALVNLLSQYDSISTDVGDACVNLQEVANADKIDVDIGCRGATAEFKCYSTNSGSASRAKSFDDARSRVESVVGSKARIPANIPAWVSDYQVGLETQPVEPSDPNAADIRFGSESDRSRPQVILAFTPRPYCPSSKTPEFVTTTEIGSTEIKIVSDDPDRLFKGLSGTLKLNDIVVTIRAFWETASAPSYDDMVPTIVEWTRLVLDEDNQRAAATPAATP